MAIKQLTATVTDCSQILSIAVSDSHVAPTSTAIISCVETDLEIGDEVTVVMGYVGDTWTAFTGFVKQKEIKEPEMFYTLTCSNVLIRAVDYFIASSNPEEPFSRQNISAEDLIQDVLELSGLTSFDFDATLFTLAISNPVEVNLTPAYDYARFIADIIAFNIYADNDGVVHLINRRPYPVPADSSVLTIDPSMFVDCVFETTDRDLRNKILVYGSAGISAEASAVSPYLPAGYYRTVVVAAPGVIDSQDMAEQSAEYNLDLLNKLTYKLSISMLGVTELIARTCVTMDIPEFDINDEKWYIYAIEHNWSRAGYLTNLELRK